MSCGPASAEVARAAPQGVIEALSDEGFRLFFPLGALYAALWPMLWVVVLQYDLPLARTVPPALWHAHEMLIGAFGAALIGFITTAAPEWTDTPPPRGRVLWALAGLWALGRGVGVLGWDGMGALGAVVDLAWLTALLVYLIRLSLNRRTDRLIAFAFWLAVLILCVAATRFGFLVAQIEFATRAIQLVGFAYLGLLGMALARITVPVTNLVLDPTEATSPFRPHPGRLHLAPGLVLVAMVAIAIEPSPAVTGFVIFAAGAAFMDRVSEAFIGRAALRTEIMLLAGSSACAGLGLMMVGAAMLGALWTAIAGLHLAFMGGLGLGVYAVFCIAGLLHTDRPLGFSWPLKLGVLAICLSVALRIAPELGVLTAGPALSLSALFWAAGFLIWLLSNWTAILNVGGQAQASPQAGQSSA